MAGPPGVREHPTLPACRSPRKTGKVTVAERAPIENQRASLVEPNRVTRGGAGEVRNKKFTRTGEGKHVQETDDRNRGERGPAGDHGVHVPGPGGNVRRYRHRPRAAGLLSARGRDPGSGTERGALPGPGGRLPSPL